MRLNEILRPECVFPDLKARSREEVLAELVDGIAVFLPASRKQLVTALLEREQQAPTAISGGVAVPHARVPELARFILAVGRSRPGVPFGAEDGDTRVFFLLMSPAAQTAAHLKALARIARLLRNPALKEDLVRAGDSDEIYRRILREDELT